MRIVIAGQKLFGAAVLRELLDAGHEIAAVFSPAFSGDDCRPDRLRDAAERSGVPWYRADQLRADTLPAATDLIVAAHSHSFIGRPTRLAAKLGAIGYHPSLLPRHRGRDAIAWAIRMREPVTGGSVYWLSEGIDAGDLAAQQHVFIRPDDTPAELWRRALFDLGVRLIRWVIEDLSRGVVVRVPQDHSLATWEPALDRPPLYRPELPMLGCIPGYEVRATFAEYSRAPLGKTARSAQPAIRVPGGENGDQGCAPV